ncbi:Lon protease family protein [Sulfurivermis fontis]|uniref:Lon protease family protein n=1 Tax=Sulfurivermis fontis TaxID=1972068 RepID=UPI000FD9D147|nr:ATP-binding protein [Sulfurivermis fontis]
MTKPEPLAPDALYKRCDPGLFSFETTAELPDVSGIIGQNRAIGAVRFGVNIQREGYNLYVMGPPGIGKHTLVRQFLEQKAAGRTTPDDWCYVNNFEQGHKPHALRLPPGRGTALKRDMEKLVEELGVVLPATFEGEEYRSRIQALEEELKERQEHGFSNLAEEAGNHNIKLFRTPSGFAFAPLKDDEVLGPDEFEKLPKEEQTRIEQVVAALQEKLQALIRQIPQWRKETREKVKDLNRETTRTAVSHLIDEVKERYADLPRVVEYLATVEQDVIDNVRNFVHGDEGSEGMPDGKGESLHRYQVNVLVDNKDTEGAPIVYLDNPTYLNLVGRAEHIAQFGTLITDFTLIKPGALHQACGGYLLVDAYKLLTHPFAWEGLKRALYSGEIRIESLEKMLSLVSTVSLEPEAIPLDVKVVIVGDRMTYYLLHEYDPDFAELFKVAADFEGRIPRNDDNKRIYAQLIATLARKEKLRPFDRHAVARVIEHGSRLVEDTEHLTAHMRSIADVLREADYWAGEAGHAVVGSADIQQAIEHQVHRSSRVREHLLEEIRRGTIMIDTDGSRVGQINGLSVLSMGDFAFGQPSRITATVHIGEGSVVDIEREVELGGAIHSKGVLILSSFLAARYATHHPLALSASLVFEQNYGMVDGDSASLAELCALLSAIAGLPILQSFAVTGSVNQHGQVQPIGGVNEKIEGFFDVCRLKGLNGRQGVLIPASNVKHLMLRQDVVQAVSEGQFHVYAVETVDQALSLLLDTEAGVQDADGNWPEDSVNGRVQARLSEMAHIRASFGDHARDKGDGSPAPDTSDADAPPRHVD